MTGEKKYVQVPLDADGKAVSLIPTATVGFEGLTPANYQWVIGAHYRISGNSGPTMTVHVHQVVTPAGAGAGTGKLEVHYTDEDVYGNVVPIAGQTISDITDPDNPVAVATTTADILDVYYNSTNVVGFDNPGYGLDVDITGSANVRFAEGLPQLDAWGKLRTSGATVLGQYVLGQEEKFLDNFSPVNIEGGYTTFSDTRKSVRIGIDDQAANFDGTDAFAAATSNQYHNYVAGSSHLYAATVRINSPASTGSLRRWGLFDANNGFFFMVGTGGVNATDDTGFSVVVRSNIPEAAQKDTYINRNDWNGDKLDGTGDSQATLDLEQVNLWWIDVQWHGAGRVRFGTYLNGQRVICHSYYQGNLYQQAMSQTTSLPVCYSNKSTVSTASNLYLETWSAAVWTETDIDLTTFGKPASYSTTKLAVTDQIDANWTYLFSLSPLELLSSGDVNHTIYIPTNINAVVYQDSGSFAAELAEIKMEINSVHDGHAFLTLPGTSVAVSTAGTSYEGGRVILQDTFRDRFESDLTDTFNNFQYGSVKNLSEDGGTVTNTVSDITRATTAVLTMDSSEILNKKLREPQQATFPLNTSIFGGKCRIENSSVPEFNVDVYLKATSNLTYELYTDVTIDANGNITYNTPLDSSAFPSAFTGTATITGFYGSRVIWSFFARTASANADRVAKFALTWKEIVQ